jgi:hypothetical protein
MEAKQKLLFLSVFHRNSGKEYDAKIVVTVVLLNKRLRSDLP